MGPLLLVLNESSLLMLYVHYVCSPYYICIMLYENSSR